jgi:hypothetical protein
LYVPAARRYGVTAAFVPLELMSLSLLAPRSGAWTQEPLPPHQHHLVSRAYSMDAATMSLELHGCGIHAV